MDSAQVSLPPIDSLNETKGDPESFFEFVTPLLEKSPRLIKKLYLHLPFTSYKQLLERAKQIIFSEFSQEDKVELINSHPRLGTDASKLRGLSKVEQGYSTDMKQSSNSVSWSELNSAYESKFGFKFVIFVNKRPISELVPVIETILSDSSITRDSEIDRAIQAFLDIANDRMKTLML